MTFVALLLVWLSGFMAMTAIVCFSDRDRWTGFIYAVLAVGFVIPAVMEWGMLP